MFKIESTVEVIDETTRRGMIGRVEKNFMSENVTEYFVRFTVNDRVWLPESSLKEVARDEYMCEFCNLGRPIINTNEEQMYIN